MKIEWLDSPRGRLMRARITRRAWPKFWVKVTAVVELIETPTGKYRDNDPPWYFEGTYVKIPGDFGMGGWGLDSKWFGLQGKLHNARWRIIYAEESRRRELMQAKEREEYKKALAKQWSAVEKPAALPEARVEKRR